MAEVEGVEVQSAVLTEGEVEEVVSEETQTEEVGLPSDEVEFEVPEKFKGKSAEDIIKSYQELEKLHAKKGGEEEVSQEEKPEDKPEGEETSKEEVSQLSTEELSTFEQSYKENGGLTEEDYAALEKKGFSKEQIDEEISYREYKEEKAINQVIEPLGGGKEKLQEVVKWAGENKTPEEVQAFNSALASAPLVAQQAMLKGLYAEYDTSGSSTTEVYHSGSGTKGPSKGYATEADFMKDLDHPAYKTDKSFVKKVETKLGISNTDEWSF